MKRIAKKNFSTPLRVVNVELLHDVTRAPVILTINNNPPPPVVPPHVFRRPVLGGVIDTKHLPPPAGAASKTPSIPSIKGPLLTPPFEKLRKKATGTRNKVLQSLGSSRRQGNIDSL